MMTMIITSECEKCAHSTINNENKARITVYCKAKDKTYSYGQCIPCDQKRKER